nr:RNA-directed DNA polymerase, eukaryota, reverse transcriptase zinc-binding domain protein [Tanacetum cinerariifolium]
LWNTCKPYGFVVDDFIPTRRSKAGKRFSFVRFINVFDAERLVNNLCTIWIGRYKIHANIAWFQRASMNNSSSQFKNNEAKRNYTYTDTKGHANSYLHAVKGFQKTNLGNESNPVLVLDDSCLNQREYSYCLLGKVKEFSSLSNLKTVLVCEGFENVKIRYLGGFWVMFEFTTEEVKKKFQSYTTISSWFSQIQQATCDFTNDGRVSWVEIEGKSYWIRAKEVPGWVPNFFEATDKGDESDDDDEGEPKGVMLGDSDVEAIPDTMFEEVLPNANRGDAPSVGNKEMHLEDPFNIYDLLKSAKRKDSTQEKDEGIQNIPEDDVSSEVRKSDLKMHDKENGTDSAWSGHFKKSDISYSGGSILLVMDELVKVGQTIGYNMEGCLAKKAKKDWVNDLCMKNKVNFLSLQETKMEKIELFDIMRCWGNFSFEYVHSDSMGNSGGILCVWDTNSFFKHNATVSDYFVAVRGEVIIMGDFNEVGNKTKRFGLVFNSQGANAFNTFILSSRLAKVPLGGWSFSWFYKSATKMSKLDRFLISECLISSCPNISAISLDHFLSDHLPILLREFMLDYGPTPFRFFHYWIEVDVFIKMVEDTWNVASAHLDALIDNGNGTEATVQKRTTLVDSILKDKKLHSMEAVQKAKIKWAVEGDENSKFYHGILNNKRNQLSIRGVLVDDCGIDKSPGPDGFTFGFYRHFWKLIEKDVVDAVKYFFKHGAVPKGSKSSFIALIPKNPGSNKVKDFRPLSLIGSFYKIIAKILANQLIFVLGDIVNEVQSAFVVDRQILDDPFILNELLQWSKSKKKQTMILRLTLRRLLIRSVGIIWMMS